MNRYYTLRNNFLSRSVNLSSLFMIFIFIILTLSLTVISLLAGNIDISIYDLFNWLFSSQVTQYDFIINHIRLPRIIMAGIVGALLGMSGLILQIIIKNPLSSPDILGISNGASVGVILFLSYFASTVSIQWLPLSGMIGAFITIFFIYTLSLSKNLIPERIILIGIAISLFMGSIATFLFVFSPSQATLSAYLWLTGSVYGTDWNEIKIISLSVVLILPILIFISRHINYMSLDDSLSTSLGLKIFKIRTLLLFISVAFAGIAISFAGAISFVGLISPHIAKRLIEHNFSNLVILSALVGAIIVITADLIGRTMFSPLDLPAGIFVSLIGAPFFIYLLIKQFSSKKV